jgi:hypothetical protein
VAVAITRSDLMAEWPDNRRRSTALVAVVGAALALIAAPPALGAKPTKTVFPAEGFVIPAGEGCASAVEEQVPEGTTVVIKEFSDGRIVTHGNSEPTLRKLDTGDSFVQKSRATVTETYDPETNDVLVEISGRIFVSFLPGEQGPFGEVGANGALFSVIGHQQLTFDLDSNLTTSYSLNGQAIDICPPALGLRALGKSNRRWLASARLRTRASAALPPAGGYWAGDVAGER